MKADIEIENENMNEELQEELSSPQKRGSPLKSSSGNPRRKKQKHSSRDKQKPPDGAVDDKENNGRHPSPSDSNMSKSHEPESGNDFLVGRNKNPKNRPPEAGVITKIHVENFMCHKKLTVDLCRNVNFIYGQNGSGKSAILAAIQICLGAGARRTNRARSLKELVRKDTTSNYAKVRVTLLNRGTDSFQHDIYGDYITVERTIALRGGYNGYKLFNADNIEQSRSKQDLNEMLDKLNIQVENPVAILDQEEAKKFLTGKAEAKYQFFMKATELERLDNSYSSTLDRLIEMKQQSTKLEQSLEMDKQLVAETKYAYQQHQIIGKLEGKKAKYETDLGWSNYKVSIKEQQAKIENLEKFKEKAEKKKQELTQAELATQEMEDPNDERRSRLEALSNEANQMSARKEELEQELKRAKAPQKNSARTVKELKKQEERANQCLLEANQRLQARRDEIVAKAGSAESDQARRSQRLQIAEKKLVEEKNRHNELKQSVTDSYNAYEDLEPEVVAARDIVSQLKNQMRGIEGKIRSMESSSGNSLDIFGPRCAKVKQMVDRATQQRKFRGPVLGPIGFYCKIQQGKEDFASLAEIAIGNGVLDRFVVFNDGDRQLFQKIRRDAGCQMDCGIFQQPQHARYRVPEPPQGVETVATVVSIENDLIFNCIVDNSKIETKALSRTKKESEDSLLVKDANNRYTIRGGKIKEVYLLPKGDNWRVAKGNIQMISNTRRAKKTIGADMTAAIQDAKNEYQSMNEELTAKNKDYHRLEHAHTQHKKQWNANKRELRKNEHEIDRIAKDIEDIKAEEAASIDNNIDVTEEEEDVVGAQAHLDEIKENRRLAENEMKKHTPHIQAIEEKLDEITARNKKVLIDIGKAQENSMQHYQAIREQKEKVAKKRRKLEQYEEVVAAHAKEIKEGQEETEQYLKMAQHIQHCHNHSDKQRKRREDNVQDNDAPISDLNQEPTQEELELIGIPEDLEKLEDQTYYEEKIIRINQRIELEKKRRLENSDDEPTAYSKYTRAYQTFRSKKDQIEEIKSMSDNMKSDLELRTKRWKEFREFITEFSTVKFDETLQLKGSSGCIEFNHDNEVLDLIVQKDSKNEQSQQKDVKALSGGERSFTTISLLLAIGEMLETPFRVMDEFDVFLDPVTRRKIIDVLVEVGNKMCHRQFIFITPQDVSHLESTPTLKILQMKPPKRRTVAGGQEQLTLDFSPSQQ